MTELSFLVDLLLNHKLQKITKDAIAGRIKDISTVETSHTVISTWNTPQISPEVGVLKQWTSSSTSQAPSTQAILDKNPDLLAQMYKKPEPPPVAPENVAQTPATQAAIASRQAAIDASMNGKVDKETGRPRKF